MRYEPGTDLDSATLQMTAAVTEEGCPNLACSVTSDQRPGEIQNYASVRDTPLVLAAVLALLAAGTLAHVLLTGVRRRRRDLAVLKTLGLTRAQLLRVVSWQASALATAALLAGLPLGVLAGRVVLGTVRRIGRRSRPGRHPRAAGAARHPRCALLANLIAAGPGWAAAQIRPAIILRSE